MRCRWSFANIRNQNRPERPGACRSLTPEDLEQNQARQPLSFTIDDLRFTIADREQPNRTNKEQTPKTVAAIYDRREQRQSQTAATIFMSDILNKTIVLVLNRNWQAIHVRTPQE